MKRSFQFILFINLSVSLLSVFSQSALGQASTNDGVPQSSLVKCLPADIKLNDVVDAISNGYANGQPAGLQKVTVEQKLNELKATCTRENKLIDGSGKQVVFYHLIGCWGNPPRDYQEILQKQRDDIERLKQQYTVIEMTCNPSGINIQ